MKKECILIAGAVLILTFVGCDSTKVQDSSTVKNNISVKQTQEKVKREEVVFRNFESIFGFTDESGKNIITIPNENGDELKNPEQFNIAVGNNGEIIEIEFVERQEANDMDNCRQTADNFSNMAGYVYTVKAGELIQYPNILNNTYMLSKDTVMLKNALVKLKSTRDTQSEYDYYKKVDKETTEKIEAIKNRKIIEGDLISETEDNAKICLFVFERKADDMLASIAYIKGDKVIFKDYPAKYDESSTWRVDAGDQPGLFRVLFLANSDEGLLLGITWAAPEGESEYILKEVNGVFQETDFKSGRYWGGLF